MILKLGLYSLALPVLPDETLKIFFFLNTSIAELTDLFEALTTFANLVIVHQHLSSLKLKAFVSIFATRIVTPDMPWICDTDTRKASLSNGSCSFVDTSFICFPLLHPLSDTSQSLHEFLNLGTEFFCLF